MTSPIRLTIRGQSAETDAPTVEDLLGDFAQRLMLTGYPKLRSFDAIHLATACIADVDEFHTFDNDLLALDGRIDKLSGTRLVIAKPAVPAPPAPLLAEMQRGQNRE